MMQLTMGSLFDGIGGFPLAAERCGITPVWASEIEPFPIEVIRTHFPNMLHVGDMDNAIHIDTTGSTSRETITGITYLYMKREEVIAKEAA